MDQEKNIVELFEKAGIKLDTKKEPVQKETNDVLTDAVDIGKEDNANDIMHTTNTGYGKELVPLNVLSQQVHEAVPTYGQFIGALPGFHGSDMAISEKVSIIGDPGYFRGNTEATTTAMAIAQGTNLLPTADITITQNELIMSVDISRRELTYSIIDLQALLLTKIGQAAAQTFEDMIVNGDAETGATGNVNSDDQAPATTFTASGGAVYHTLLNDHGLRELAINGTSLTHDAGTLAIPDFLSVMALLGHYAATPADNMWLVDSATYLKMLGITELFTMSINGKQSTIFDPAITNIFGSDLVIPKGMRKTEADGKLSGATLTDNTLGQIAYFRKAAVQWGYGRPIEFDVVKIPGKGVQVVATAEFGFAIVQQEAGVAESSVGLGINVTV